jgi:hypothetical protein
MQARKIALGATVVALLGAGGYGVAVWWPQHQAKAAETQANALFGYVRTVTGDLKTGTATYSKGTVTYAPVTFTLPQTEPHPPVNVTIPRLTVTPDGVATLTDASLAISTPDGNLTIGAANSTLSAFRVANGIPLHLAGQISNPTLAGDVVEKLKRQRALVDMLLANAPKAVQTIPDQVLNSLATLTLSADLRYDPEKQHLSYRGGYTLPGLLSLSVAFAADAITVDAMKSINILHDPALKPLENSALAELSKGAALSHIAQQGDLEQIHLNLTDQGLLRSVVQVYGSVAKLPEAEARDKIVAMVHDYPLESLIAAPTPQTLQVLDDARSALTTLIKGEATQLVIEARPRARTEAQSMQQKLATLNDMAAALDIDVSARK